MTRADIFREIGDERHRQEVKWSGQTCALPSIGPTPLAVTVLTEEVGEVARACLESDTVQMRLELVQVAAVAVAMIEGIDAAWMQSSSPSLDSGTGRPIG